MGDKSLFFSMYGEGSSNNKFLEIYNPFDYDIDLNYNNYTLQAVYNTPSSIPEAIYHLTGSIPAKGVYILFHSSADPSILDRVTHYNHQNLNYLSNGDDGFKLVKDNQVIDTIGNFLGDPGYGWDVAGVPEATRDHTLIRKSYIFKGNFDNWDIAAGTDENNSEWIVCERDSNWDKIGTHTTNYRFNTKTQLQTAVESWISDQTSALNTYGEINTWDVSQITDMSELFYNKTNFNSYIGDWDTSSVTNMSFMFHAE